MDKIKTLNIKIKEILWFFYYLIDNKEEGFEGEVKEHLIKLKEKGIQRTKEKEKREKKREIKSKGLSLKNKKRPRLDKGKRGKRNRQNTDSDNE